MIARLRPCQPFAVRCRSTPTSTTLHSFSFPTTAVFVSRAKSLCSFRLFDRKEFNHCVGLSASLTFNNTCAAACGARRICLRSQCVCDDGFAGVNCIVEPRFVSIASPIMVNEFSLYQQSIKLTSGFAICLCMFALAFNRQTHTEATRVC